MFRMLHLQGTSLTTTQQAPTPRRSMGTVRRNRNTILVPGNQSIPEMPQEPTYASPPLSAPLPTSPDAPLDIASTPPPPRDLGSPVSQQSPLKLAHRNNLGLDDHTGSDTHSIRSGRSLNSTVSNTVRHPDMHEPGLNSSLVETIGATFTDGKVVRANLIGEVALSFIPTDLNGPFGTETIRLENLSANDKLAPNPAFIDTLPDRPGQFTINLGQITKTQVAFKYQIPLTAEESSSRVPLLLHPQWRVTPTQTDCKLHYTLNPDYPSPSLTFTDLTIILHIDPTSTARLQSCRASDGFKFRKESSLVYWRLGDVTLTKDAPLKPLLARFMTEGEVKPGGAEARWEVAGVVGSGIRILKLEEGKGKGKVVEEVEEEDPFADEGEKGKGVEREREKENWRDVGSVMRWRAGTYVATAS